MIVTVPEVVTPVKSMLAGSPAVIETAGLFEDQVTPAVTSCGPETPETSAITTTVTGTSESSVLDGEKVIVKFVPFSTQTVADAVAVIPWSSAVIVAAAVLMSVPVRTPELLTVMPPPLLVHVTLLEILPAEELSVLVPKASSCVVPPSGTVGVDGEMVMEASCSGTKKPLQLTASARVASAAKAPARWSFCFVDDIVGWDSLGAPARLEPDSRCISFLLHIFRIRFPRSDGCKKL